MIADELGVSKAAVYYQFPAKEDIVHALLDPLFESLRSVIDATDAAPTSDDAQRICIAGLIDAMVEHRRMAAATYRDPEIERLVATRPDLQPVTERLGEILLGPRPDATRRVAVSLLRAGLPHPGVDPSLSDLNDQELRTALVEVTRALLGNPPARKLR